MNTNIIKQQLADLQRLLKNTESFLYGFLHFTTTQKAPFPNSWLGFDIDANRYVFVVLNPATQYTMGEKMVFYPNSTNRILISPDTEWLYAVISEVTYGSHRNDKEEFLLKVASKLQPQIVKMVKNEIEALKQKINLSLTVNESVVRLF